MASFCRWPTGLPAPVTLGPGLDPEPLTAALRRLCAVPGVRAVVAFGSRGRGDAHCESDLDLAVICAEPRLTPQQKPERLAGSRWHVMGDVAREGRVLYVAG